MPLGSFAEAQATFLHPDQASIAALDARLQATGAGVVAHFYMDAELQGALFACKHPHIHIADSLQMADRAVAMAAAGARAILVAGVDFMSENVRAVLDHAGHAEVPVYRLATEPIGCSLAESAERPAYGAFLAEAARTPHSLHVVYINTSLRVKALAHERVPTITCTSSNVVQTVLQATAQVPDLHVWYGPDTYMGENLRTLFTAWSVRCDADVRALHPAHDAASLRGLLERFHPFQQGVCVVHHLFGASVAARVRREHGDDLLTAHLEVPGEMFALAADAQQRGRGVVGSTSNILDFIGRHVDAAVALPARVGGAASVVRVVLGTEAGMVTSIVRSVQARLRAGGRDDVHVEVVFPVAADAVTAAPGTELGVVPGAAQAEGCSVAGGCATCPYMKKNSLDALFEALDDVAAGRPRLADLLPRLAPHRVGGRSVAEAGSVPIVHMREFQRTGRLPEALVADVLAR